MSFVHLHVHSEFSLLDGAASINALAGKARALGMEALAITDHGNLFGAAAFEEACAGNADHPLKEGIPPLRPIIGCEFYMAPGSRFVKQKDERDNKYYHLVLLAKNVEGYQNLIQLSSLSFTEGFYYKPRIDWELLEKYKGGLICLSACIAGEIPSLVLDGKRAEAEKKALLLRDLFGKDEDGEPNFYIELQDHRLDVQERSNPVLIDIARKYEIPLVVTNDVHYLDKDDYIAHDVLLCVGTKKKRADTERMKFESPEFYFKTEEEMASLFPELPETISNTVKIARRCNLQIPRPGPLLPEFEIPAGFDSTASYLRYLTFEGLKKRYSDPIPAHIIERAEYELDTITKMDFTGYFLIVQDFIGWAKDNGVAVGPGRGSGAGSVAAYALRITDIDPFKYNLLFERFLNPERVSMPDFDIDFGEGREKVIDYVTDKYGKERVAQILTIGTLKARAVVKDVARVLGISIDESDMLTKLIPYRVPDPKKPGDTVETTLELAFRNEPKLAALAEEPKYKELFEIAQKLEGKARQSGIHAAGVVIGRTKITDYVPVFRDKNDCIAVQYDKNQIEPFGLVKMDFLGLATLDVITTCERLVRRRGGELSNFSILNIPEDDKKTFQLFCKGNTLGVFQFESEGMRNVLVQAKPESIADLTALNALYRPGPMDYIPQFIAGKKDARKIHYPHPDLEDLLKETYGVFVYQEQVMQAAQIIAGYTLGSADILRRAMGKKKPAEMEKQKKIFIEGAEKRGIPRKKAEEIFNILIPFAGYGFNKSHAAAYSVLAYQTGYLKTNFPVEFQAATLTNVMGNPDKLSEYIEETQKLGLTLVPPDINKSINVFSVAEGKIVYGFTAIKGVGDGPAEYITAERDKNGVFTSFVDFIKRCDFKKCGKKAVELLIDSGAFDSLDKRRGMLKGNLEGLVKWASSEKAARDAGQAGLFDMMADGETGSDYQMKDFPEPSNEEKLETEKALLGFYLSGHPLDNYKAAWEKFSNLDLRNLDDKKAGDYTIVGIIKEIKPYTMKDGKRMAFGRIADYKGEAELLFFNEVWQTLSEKISLNSAVGIKGKLSHKNNKTSFIVEKLINIDNVTKDIVGNEVTSNSLINNDISDIEKADAFASASANKYAYPEIDSAEGLKNFKVAEPAVVFNQVDSMRNSAPPSALHIRLDAAAAADSSQLHPLKTFLSGSPGECSVLLHVPVGGGEKIVQPSNKVRSSYDCIDNLKQLSVVANAWFDKPPAGLRRA